MRRVAVSSFLPIDGETASSGRQQSPTVGQIRKAPYHDCKSLNAFDEDVILGMATTLLELAVITAASATTGRTIDKARVSRCVRRTGRSDGGKRPQPQRREGGRLPAAVAGLQA